MDISLFRWRDGGWRELALAPDARPVSCAEGHRLRVTVSAGSAPIVHLGGDDLVPKTLGIRNGAVEAVYEFVIDSWAGRTGLVAAGDGELRRICLDVEPHPGKLGLDAFSGLLMELSARSAALPWGPSPGSRSGRLAGPSAAVVFPAVLDALLPELLRQLRRFLRDPPLAIRRRRDVTPLSMARRPDTQTVRWLVNHPRSLAAVRPGDFGGTGERIAALPLVDQPVAVTNHDHPVTRHLLFQLLRIGRMVDGTVRRLDTLANKGGWRADPFVSGYAARIAGQCRHHRAALAEALSAPAFREAQAEPAGEGALQALADLPAAAAVQRLAHRLLNAGLASGRQRRRHRRSGPEADMRPVRGRRLLPAGRHSPDVPRRGLGSDAGSRRTQARREAGDGGGLARRGRRNRAAALPAEISRAVRRSPPNGTA